MIMDYFNRKLLAALCALAAALACAQTTPVVATETPDAVPIRARTTPLPPPKAVLDQKGVVSTPSPAAASAAASKVQSQTGAGKTAAAAPAPLPAPSINEADIGFPVLPVTQTGQPALPSTNSPPRQAPVRAPTKSALTGKPTTSDTARSEQPNVAPPQIRTGTTRGDGDSNASLETSTRRRAQGEDDLSTLMAPPASPQTRPLPGLGTVPGTIAAANPQIIRSRSGVNHLVPLALKYPNRIVTPFRKPEVIEDGLEIMVKGNSVYVKLDDATPRGVLFIHDADAPSGAVIQLTVIGRAIPPQTVIAQLDTTSGVVEAADDSDYLSSIKSLVRTLLRGGLPQGYSEETLDVPMASSSNALQIQPERRFAGSLNEVLRYSIRNVSSQPLTLSEEMFGESHVRAVAFAPPLTLQPGDKTTVYIIARLKED